MIRLDRKRQVVGTSILFPGKVVFRTSPVSSSPWGPAEACWRWTRSAWSGEYWFWDSQSSIGLASRLAQLSFQPQVQHLSASEPSRAFLCNFLPSSSITTLAGNDSSVCKINPSNPLSNAYETYIMLFFGCGCFKFMSMVLYHKSQSSSYFFHLMLCF